jgi:uncharacterized protein (DUF58 family)
VSSRLGPLGLLTRSGRALAAAAVALIAVGLAAGIVEVVALGIIGVALVVVCLAWVTLRHPNLTVERRVSPRPVHVGTECRVELAVTNAGRRTSPVATMHDPVSSTVGARLWLGSLRPRGRGTATYRLPTEHRGRFDIGPLRVTVTDPFGLATFERSIGDATHATVLPKVDRIAATVTGGGRDQRAGAPRHEVGNTGEEFAGLRPYVRGDDLRRVHWRSSARATDLLVRQDEPPAAGRVAVLVDVRSNTAGPAAQEHVVSAAASILTACANRGEALRLLTSAGHDSASESGPRQLHRLLDQLAVLEPGTDPSLTPALRALRRQPANTLVVVAADISMADLAGLGSVAKRATLVWFDPTSWPLGVGQGLPVVWSPSARAGGGEPAGIDRRSLRSLPPGFMTVVPVTASSPFPQAWKRAS